MKHSYYFFDVCTNILSPFTGAGPGIQRERSPTDVRFRCRYRPPAHACRAHMSPCQR